MRQGYIGQLAHVLADAEAGRICVEVFLLPTKRCT
eukprot:COSAG01_NODE_1494_length_10125_cov_93.590805_14_plen_34_part_01